MAVIFTNNAFGALSAAITDSATTLVLGNGEGARFPSPTAGDWFPVTVQLNSDVEIMRCTARNNDELTVVRAQEGATALAFDAGASVELRITAAVLTALEATGKGDMIGPSASVDGEVPAFSGTSGKALKRTPLRLDDAGNLWGAGLKVEEVAGTTYALTAADNGKVLWFTSADPVAVTMPDNATTAIPGGFNVILAQGGAGAVTATGEGSDTVVSPDDPITTSGVGTAVSIIKKADTVWWASAGGSGGGGGGSTGANVEVISATSYTISEADNGKVLWFTAATAVTVTMPGTTALPMGANIEGAIIQAGAGTVTVQGDAESSIAAEGGLVASAAQYAPMSFFRQAANLWWLGGQRA